MFECEDSRSTPFSSISDQIASTNPRCVVLDVGLIRQACEISSYILSSQVMRSLLPATDAATPAKPTSPKTGGRLHKWLFWLLGFSFSVVGTFVFDLSFLRCCSTCDSFNSCRCRAFWQATIRLVQPSDLEKPHGYHSGT